VLAASANDVDQRLERIIKLMQRAGGRMGDWPFEQA